ncbi:MAG: F0F1 ATP synthase subunit A [Thermomicrobiales bacterium]
MEVHVEIAAETLFHVGPVPVTNSMLTMFIVMAAVLLIFSWLARRAQMIPTRGQGVLELIVEFMLGLVEGTAGKRAGRRIFPLVAGLFIFIIFANYSGLLPGVGTIGYWEEEEAEEASGEHDSAAAAAEIAAIQTDSEEAAPAEEHEKVLVPFFRSPSADLNMTLAMAFLSFFIFQVAGISAHGVVGRIKHMASPWWIFPLEVVQEFARIISLAFRLFGNIFAGEVLLAVMYAMASAIKIALIPVLFPVVFLFLEVLFGAIQALVFALLSLIYITLATAGAHDQEEHEHDVEPEPGHGSPAVPAGAGD